MTDPGELVAIVTRYDTTIARLEGRLSQIRELHEAVPIGEDAACAECSVIDEDDPDSEHLVEWPCATVRLANGEEL